ncbi:MAG: dehydrogenase E1 component subunit alpha/beta [Bacteroidota bacterium]
MHFYRRHLTDAQLLQLYEQLLLPRMIEEKMLLYLRQGKISKWFSGIGQEAISVGITAALNPEDYLLPLHRNLGVFTTRGLTLESLFCQWQGKAGGFTQGRDRSFHFGSPKDRIIGMISHLGAMLPVADGLALASKLKGESWIATVFSGDGGTSEGDFHEALNLASVWDLPVLFVVENNGYGLSTPTEEQYRCKQLADRAKGYGMEGYTIDGNNVLEVYHFVKDVATQMREDHQPVLLECNTFRMRGHEEASGTKYVPQELFDTWAEKDPIATYTQFLHTEGVLTDEFEADIRAKHTAYIEAELQAAQESADISPDVTHETQQVFAPSSAALTPPADTTKEIRMVDAIAESLEASLHEHENLVFMGQDVAGYGGVFKISEGFADTFGKGRIRNTPICESAVIGAGLGLSLSGMKAVVEMQFADFVSCGFNQIVNNLAKNHYRWGHAPDVVVRMPCGGGVGAGPFHSQTNEGWFTQVPGLKIVYPAFPEDAKGLLSTAIQDPNPVLFFEHKAMYRSIKGEVPTNHYHLPIGKANRVLMGDDLTVITYGMGVHWALEATASFDAGVIEVIDLRSLIPWDQETVFESVRKTGKCLVLYEASHTSAFGAEIAATIGEVCFTSLDAPVRRLGAMDTPVPFHVELERQYLPKERLNGVLEELLGY